MSPLSEADQQVLLEVARRTLEESVRGRRLPEFHGLSAVLEEYRGAFVTLRRARHLRGCIGVVEAYQPLYRTVVDCAVSAALRDPRFQPVTPEELPEVRAEISVLSPLADVAVGEIEVGRHGLLVSQGDQRGVLLPQVAVEWNWDREQFLAETCRKAGLPKDAWKRGARIQAFKVQVFGESSQTVHPPAHTANASRR